MPTINTCDLAPGMVLAAEARARNGRMLLPAGTALTDRQIKTLLAWGVTGVEVEEGGPPAPAGCPDPGREAACRRELDALFPDKGCDAPAAAELYRLCLERCLREPTPPFPPPIPEQPASPRAAAPDLDELAEKGSRLASLPDVYYRIMDALNDPTSSAGALAEAVGSDPGLSARLLRLVNSPVFGLPRAVDTLSRGILLLGARELSQMALGISVMRAFEGVPEGIFDLRAFWEHSIACGAFARFLAAQARGLHEEQLFLSGLLHDVGRLVMVRAAPEALAQAQALARRRGCSMEQAETDVFGYTHEDAAARIFQCWNLPEAIARPIARHHSPALDPHCRETAVVHLADVLALALRFGFSGSCRIGGIDPSAWDRLDLPVSALSAVAAAGRRQIRDIVAVFFG